jgi:hypothetical protein
MSLRTMGAGLAGSSVYGVNVSGNFGGGSKKQGLPSTTNRPSQFITSFIRSRASSNNKKVYFINQLGGIGASGIPGNSRMFAPRADGVKNNRRKRLNIIFS